MRRQWSQHRGRVERHTRTGKIWDNYEKDVMSRELSPTLPRCEINRGETRLRRTPSREEHRLEKGVV